MTDDAKRLVSSLRNSYGYSSQRDNEAADMIEKLSADLESDERQYGRDAFAVLADEGAKLEAERNEWKRRAEAAERDLRGTCWSCAHAEAYEVLLGCKAYKCDYHDSITDRVTRFNCKDWEWRGPCAENGGTGNADKG